MRGSSFLRRISRAAGRACWLACLVAVLAGVSVPSTDAMARSLRECAPLLVFVSGSSENMEIINGSRMMTRLYKDKAKIWRERGAMTRLLEWGSIWGSNDEKIDNVVKRHVNTVRGRGIAAPPVVLVGYSYGGDTAYLTAYELWDDGYRVMLVTLDPVGSRASRSCDIFRILCVNIAPIVPPFLPLLPSPIPLLFDDPIRIDNLKKPNADPWIHVWASYPEMNRCDMVAAAGGPYGHQKNATLSLKYRGDHCAVRSMFLQVESNIEDYIGRRCGQ